MTECLHTPLWPNVRILTVIDRQLVLARKRLSRWDLRSIPKNWLCLDCKLHTAPWNAGYDDHLAEFGDAFEAIMVLIFVFTEKSEIYHVLPPVWRQAGLQPLDGVLCIGCLEQRLGRQLTHEDFDPQHFFNWPSLSCTPRLRDRRKGLQCIEREPYTSNHLKTGWGG